MRADHEAEFRVFAASRWPRLVRTAYLLTGDPHDAEDLAQTVLVKAFRSWRRVQRADNVDAYLRRAPVTSNASRFRKLTGLSWKDMVSEGLATKHGKEQTWSQLIMAANTPMLLRAGLVEGRTDAGVLASGQVVGMLDDLPSVAELIAGIVAQAEKIIAGLPHLLA